MSARDDILGRVRSALAAVEPDPAPVTAPPGTRVADLVAHFAERVADYRATVVHCAAGDVAGTVAAALPAGARVVVPPGLPDDLRSALADVIVDDGLSADALDAMDAVVTCCRVAIAETGTIVLDHAPDQGRRAVTLVPDRHVCVVRADQVVADVADALAVLDPGRPLTWISGPSATSDIELDRVEGVHGPRVLHVIVVGEAG
ncbi:lactate utilization protein C [Nocardioides immobilis]|uniref:Lactate utilization protein C n=1 Tax=Nocardioides immobilis TaxID=2049295 RepID=A0A417XZ56_9ACTN|nr:LUD domain-containing protein [Nocardioides immobilis]RHW25651.1 lactate utilization protein C [Nocardioides immobilis]